MYDKFTLELVDVQLALLEMPSDWRAALASPVATPGHILDRTRLTLHVEQCVQPNNPTVPRLKVSGELQRLQLRVSDSKIARAMKLAKDLAPPATPKAATAATQGREAKAGAVLARRHEHQKEERGRSKIGHETATLTVAAAGTTREIGPLILLLCRVLFWARSLFLLGSRSPSLVSTLVLSVSLGSSLSLSLSLSWSIPIFTLPPDSRPLAYCHVASYHLSAPLSFVSLSRALSHTSLSHTHTLAPSPLQKLSRARAVVVTESGPCLVRHAAPVSAGAHLDSPTMNSTQLTAGLRTTTTRHRLPASMAPLLLRDALLCPLLLAPPSHALAPPTRRPVMQASPATNEPRTSWLWPHSLCSMSGSSSAVRRT